MKALPNLVYIVDVKREETAIHEANLLEIPVIALVDTNCDPGGVDYVIPSNDDAIRAIKLLTGKIADAALEGKALRKDIEEEPSATPAAVAAEDPALPPALRRENSAPTWGYLARFPTRPGVPVGQPVPAGVEGSGGLTRRRLTWP